MSNQLRSNKQRQQESFRRGYLKACADVKAKAEEGDLDYVLFYINKQVELIAKRRRGEK